MNSLNLNSVSWEMKHTKKSLRKYRQSLLLRQYLILGFAYTRDTLIVSTLHLDSCSKKQEFDERYLGCGFPALDLTKHYLLFHIEGRRFCQRFQDWNLLIYVDLALVSTGSTLNPSLDDVLRISSSFSMGYCHFTYNVLLSGNSFFSK